MFCSTTYDASVDLWSVGVILYGNALDYVARIRKIFYFYNPVPFLIYLVLI